MSQLILSLLGLLICFFILTVSGKYLVNISVKLARNIGVSDIFIGTTLVAFMTGAPTLLVSIIAFVSNQQDIALGNLIGTNYVNLGLALGIPAFMTTIVLKQDVFEKEIPLYFAITALFTALIMDKEISRADGLLLILFLIAAWLIIIQYAFLHKNKDTEKDFKEVVGIHSGKKNINDIAKEFLQIIGLFLVLLVASFGVSILTPLFSQVTGISSYLLGLTLVGVGTSIPAIVAGITAAKQGNNDLIVGNVFGGNILNLGLGIGLLAIIKPFSVGTGVMNDTFFINLYGAIIVILILSEMRLLGKNKTLSRLSGLIMITTYLVYAGITIVNALH
jgi:cation:H+ antiporter